jgi:MFS family permease
MTEEETHHAPAPSVPVTSVWGSQLRWLTVGLVLTVVGTAFEALAVGTVLPVTVRELGGLPLYGWVFSAYLLTNLIGITIAAGEADRLGPAKPFLIGVGLFVVGLLFGGFASSMPILIASRAVQGLGAGFIGAIAYIAIARGYPLALKPRMIAMLASAWVVPGLVGPALAGIVADVAGWRWVFLGLVPGMVVAAGMALPALLQLRAASGARRRWQRIGAAGALAAGAGLLLSGLQAQRLAWGAGLVIGGSMIALAALRHLLPAGTLRAAWGMPAAVLTSGLLNMAFFGADAFVPLGLTAVRGQSPTEAGLALTAATLTWTTGAWLQARLAPHHGRRQLVGVGLALTAVGVAGVIVMLLPAVPALLAPMLWGIAGLGMGIAYSTLSLVVLEHAPHGQEGAATSAVQLMNMLGSALGAGIGGAVIAHTTTGGQGPGAGIVHQSILMLIVLGVALLAAQRLPSRQAAKPTRTVPHEMVA